MPDLTLTSDRAPVIGAQLAHLDLTRVQQHIAGAQERGRYRGSPDPVTFLMEQQCLVVLDGAHVPTIAGLLAFAPDPEHWLRGRTGIDLAQFAGPEARSTAISFFEQVRGPLFSVIERTAELLWARSDHGYQVDESMQRIEEHAYPRIVLRELTVNAVCHRDWTKDGSRIRIQMFPRAIEWISPGSLPEGVTVANILDVQHQRNPVLADLLFQAGFIEGFGLGLDTVYAALREGQVEPPRLENAAHAFTIRVNARRLRFGDTTAVLETPEGRQETIIAMLRQRGPLPIVELTIALGVDRRTVLRDLKKLIEDARVQTLGATRNLRYALADGVSRHEA